MWALEEDSRKSLKQINGKNLYPRRAIKLYHPFLAEVVASRLFDRASRVHSDMFLPATGSIVSLYGNADADR